MNILQEKSFKKIENPWLNLKSVVGPQKILANMKKF